MAAMDVQAPPPFTENDKDWNTFIKLYEMYFMCANIQCPKRKLAILLYCGGPRIRRVHDTLGLQLYDGNGDLLKESGVDIDPYQKSIDALKNHFEPKLNITYERNKFRNEKQLEMEQSADFIARLRKLAQTCNFDNYSSEQAIVDQYIETCTSSKLRRRLLKEDGLTVAKLLEIAKTHESSVDQAGQLEGQLGNSEIETEGTFKLDSEQLNNLSLSRDNRGTRTRTVCYGCGSKDHIHGSASCPATGKECFNCKIKGHFAAVCRKPKQNRGRSQPPNRTRTTTDREGTNAVGTQSSEGLNMNLQSNSDTSEFLFSVGNKHKSVMIDIDGCNLKFIIDSGSTINIIDFDSYKLLRSSTKLYQTKTQVFTYGSAVPLKLAGIIYPVLTLGSTKTIAPIHIAQNKSAGCILSEKTSTELGLLEVKQSINTLHAGDENIQRILQRYPEILKGVGKLKDFQIDLNIDQSVDPVIQRPRTVAFHKRENTVEEMKQLIKDDLIEPVTHATTWLSPIHIEPKDDGKVRICIDLRAANKAIKRTRHPIPTIEETLEKVNGATFFSKIDLRKGYHQIELAESSRDITTFSSPMGLYRSKRLVFGLSCASEEFQKIISDIFNKEPNVNNISDDILVCGKTKREHDQALENCLRLLCENGLTINTDKCEFAKEEIEFFGFIISKDGVKPTMNKIEAILNYPTPQNVKELRSFLGLINYLNRFIPDLATECDLLRKLTRQKSVWQWGIEEEKCFQNLKRVITSPYVMAHYNKNLPTKVITDASGVGLGGMLLQKQNDGQWKVVLYLSRSLTDVERRYSQTEREALGIVWAIEKLHIYVYGAHFTVETDHKPLKGIFRPGSVVSARLLRWNLRMQPYTFTIEFIPGDKNPTDGLSRYPVSNKRCTYERSGIEKHVNYVITHAIPKAVTLSELIQAGETDTEIQMIKEALQNKKMFSNKKLSMYKKIHSELCFKSGVLLRGQRIVIPATLRDKVFGVAHETHLGIEKTKQMMRTKVWWPGMDKFIEDNIKHCESCLASQPARKPHIHEMTKIPEVWENLNIDLCGPLPDGHSLLAIVDQASRWPHVYIIKSTVTSIIIEKLTNLFAVLGKPETVISDNGPQFASKEFRAFCQEWGIKHRLVTPYHPQSNGEVERFFRTVMKIIRICMSKREDWKVPLEKFLLAYRNTPHCTTGVSPAELLLGKQTSSKLPQLKPINTVPNEVIQRDTMKKQKYYDTAKRAVPLDNFKAGDVVLVKRMNIRKGQLPFCTEKFLVLSGNHHGFTIQSENGKKYQRHSSHLRLVPDGKFNLTRPVPRTNARNNTSDIVNTNGRVRIYLEDPHTNVNVEQVLTEPIQHIPQPLNRYENNNVEEVAIPSVITTEQAQTVITSEIATPVEQLPVRSSMRIALKQSKDSTSTPDYRDISDSD